MQAKPSEPLRFAVCILVLAATLWVFWQQIEDDLFPNRAAFNHSGFSERSFLRVAKLHGALTFNPKTHRAYVNPYLWSSFDAKRKSDFTAALAKVSGERVTVIDQQSGKRLASWDSLGGFKFH